MSSADNSERLRTLLARWLAEWKLEQTLRTAPTDSGAADDSGACPGAVGIRAAAAGSPPDVGQIRLLRPGPSDDPAGRPVYVLVLEARAGESFLVAPFGRFATPGVPGEWQTGLKALPLRVLCLWNSRVVPAAVLEAGWLASRAKADTIRRAIEVHRHLREGTPLVAVEPDRVGPPLRHPLDPRHEYLAEEAALMDEHILARGLELRGAPPAITYEIPPSTLRKAAEERAEYGRRKKPGKGKGRGQRDGRSLT